MIVLVATRGRGKTVKSIARGTFGVSTPDLRYTHYERLFRAWQVPRATYIFSDLDRLPPWELQLASELYVTLKQAGLRCLNNPALAMSRVELLGTLHRRNLNPFTAYRADENPRPQRFPVFFRDEMGHAAPNKRLYHTQAEVDAGLRHLRENGKPLRGLLVTELAAEPYIQGLWAKWGTWRIGSQVVVEHIAVDDTWMVKTGDHAKISEAIAVDENEAVKNNRFDQQIKPYFDLAHIEYGRADHSTFNGRPVVFEINTNPYVGPYVADPIHLRRETQLYARSKLAKALEGIDTQSGGCVWLNGAAQRRPWRWCRPAFTGPRRP